MCMASVSEAYMWCCSELNYSLKHPSASSAPIKTQSSLKSRFLSLFEDLPVLVATHALAFVAGAAV